MNSLAGRVAVITGASRGIGAATVRELAAAGARVAAGARALGELSALAAELGTAVAPLALDVRDEASVAEFARTVDERLGAPDIVIANAGVGSFHELHEFPVLEFDEIFAVNVRGTFLTLREFLPGLRQRGRGHVVVVTSDVATRTIARGGPYAASKHAQRAMLQALAREVNPLGIRVTEIRPGLVDTHFGGRTPGSAKLSGRVALRAGDVARAIVYALAQPEEVRVDEILFHPSGHEPDWG